MTWLRKYDLEIHSLVRISSKCNLATLFSIEKYGKKT